MNILYLKQNDLLLSYSNLIKSNLNLINEISLSYDKKTYNYFLLIKSIKYLTSALINKKSSSIKEDEINIDNLFNDEDFKNILDCQYKTNKVKNLILNKITSKIKHGKLMKESNHKFGIIFMDACVKYLIDFINRLKNQLEIFSSIQNINNTETKEEKLKNHIKLFELLKLLEKWDTIDLVLNNSFYIDENDIFNIPEENEEWKK